MKGICSGKPLTWKAQNHENIPGKILCELLWITKENSLQIAPEKRDINEME